MSTSLQRTYRYLRLSIAAMVVVIFVSVGVAAPSVGWLPSISDYYFSPARTTFTGALIAVAVALLALSGRGLERVLLDAAALFAPLIAVIPTTGAYCLPRCAPSAFEADAANGIATYLVVGSLAVGVAVLLAALGQISWCSVASTAGLAAVILVALTVLWAFARGVVLAQGHVVATVTFFALFAAVTVVNAFPEGPYRAAYVTIASLLVVTLVAYVAFLPRAPVVLITESAALALFGAFWIVQSIEKWDEPNPALRAEQR